MAEQLWESLPFSRFDESDCRSEMQIVEVYEASLRRLDGYQRDIEGLFRTMCAVNLEFHCDGPLVAEVMREAVTPKLDEMYEAIHFEGVPLGQALTAKLFKYPLNVVYAALKQELERMTREFVDNIFSALDRMVAKELAGIIERESPTSCRVHFFKDIINCSTTHTSEESKESRGAPYLVGRQWKVRVMYRLTRVKQGTTNYTHARYQHDLMDVSEHDVDSSQVNVPRAVRPLIEAIPPWLKHGCRIVTGKRIREQIVQKEIGTEEWEVTEIRREEKEILHCDPVVVLDDYVLTGWGECEIEAEQKRREEFLRRERLSHQEDEVRAKGRARGRFREGAGIAAAVKLAALLLVVFGALWSVPVLKVGFGVSLVGVVLFGLALRHLAQSSSPVANWTFVASGALAALSCILGVELTAVAWISENVVLIVGGITLMLLTVPLTHMTLRFQVS
jgi:hypothetical protein